MIDFYESGEIIIEGRRYTSDVVIFPHYVKSGWWRRMGHQLCIEDLKEMIGEKPDVIVIGTGVSGRLKVPPEVQHHVETKGIKFIAQTSDSACLTYNQLCSSQKVVAAFHLTC